MSKFRKPNDPFKAFKYFVFPTDKLRDIFLLFLKSALLIALITPILFLFSAFSNRPAWFRCSNSGNDRESTSISHIVFGIGGSVDTWNDRSHYNELWWVPNVTRGYVWLNKEPGSWSNTGPPRFRRTGPSSSTQAPPRIPFVSPESCWKLSDSDCRM